MKSQERCSSCPVDEPVKPENYPTVNALDPESKRILLTSVVAPKLFEEGDTLGTIYALIKSGISAADFETILRINPNGFFETETLEICNDVYGMTFKIKAHALTELPKYAERARALFEISKKIVEERNKAEQDSNSTSDNSV